MAASCSGGGGHIRDVALNLTTRKIEAESDIFIFKRRDYTAEEWQFLYLTTGNDYYLNSVRLVGFCGVGGINWAVVTRMKEISNPSQKLIVWIRLLKVGLSCLLFLGLTARTLAWTTLCLGLGEVLCCSWLSLIRLVVR